MTPESVINFGQQALYIAMLIGAPLLLTALAVGLIIGMVQAATQINEQTLSFIPKLIAMSLVLVVAGNLLLMNSGSYTMAFVAVIIIGLGLAAGFPVILGYVGQLYRELSGTAFSISLVIALIGNTLLNYLFGYISREF